MALSALTASLGAALWQANASPDIVPLGNGLASVEAQLPGEIGPSFAAAKSRNDTSDQVASAPPAAAPTALTSEKPIGSGEASHYGNELAGNKTASGERFDPKKLTAAHRTLPLGSRVRVTNPSSGDSVVVRINDRGPFHGNRVIDLSTAAASAVGLIRSGTGRVKLALLVN